MSTCAWDDKYARLRKQLGSRHPPPYRNEVPFKVPAYLREVKPCQYTANTVCLGLNINPRLDQTRLESGIEYYKVEFQRCFLKWNAPSSNLHGITGNNGSTGAAPEFTWDNFVKQLQLEADVRFASRWYEIDTSLVRPIILENFLALDALFLVLFLRYYYNRDPQFRLPDNVYSQLGQQAVYRLLAEASSGIWRDVFLLENQIPLHILGKVWCLMPDMKSRPEKVAKDKLNKLLRELVKDRYLELFQSFSSDEDREKVVSSVLADKEFLECDHLLDCLHYVVCYSPPDDNKWVTVVDEKAVSLANTIPSANQLRKVGIQLKSDGCNFIHQIRFENSFFGRPVLRLPRLCISDQTESLLRNLAVFEMVSCYQSPHPRVGPRLATITSYLKLMNKLIHCKLDVRLMKQDEIIISGLGSNGEMFHMWNSLCKRFSIYDRNPPWVDMLTKLTARYKKPQYRYVAEFRAKYFARPWAVISWAAGGVLLLLTGFQTAYAVGAYYRATANCNGN